MITRTVLLVILSLGISRSAAFAQTTVCNDSAIMALKGKWITQHAPRPSTVTNEQYLQVTNRADAVHSLLLEAYPELVGIHEGRWWHSGGGPSFFIKGLFAYNYIGGLSPYFCAPNASPSYILGKLGAPSKPVYVLGGAMTNLMVHFNHFGDPGHGFMRAVQGMTVDGLQVFHRLPPAGTWKGYDLYVTAPNLPEKDGLVMLTRKGMLPFRAVTRKQYLDYMIATLQQQYDDQMAGVKEAERKAPELANMPEMKEQWKQLLADAAKFRDETTAVFQQELKKNAAGNTLDSSAVVAGIGATRFIDELGVFTTEEKGGSALVTVNPDYFRKDLPPYVPQFIVVHWSVEPGVAPANFRKLVEANLPIEKLQAMIDK